MELNSRLLGEAIVEVEENHRKYIELLQVENEYLRKQLRIHQNQLEILRIHYKKLQNNLIQSDNTISFYLNEHNKRLINLERRLFVNDHSIH